MALTDDPDPGRTCSAIHCEGFEVSREWLGRTFQSYGSPVFDRNPDGSIRVHAPQSRYEKAKRYALNRYGAGSFCKCKIAGLPTTNGMGIGNMIGPIGDKRIVDHSRTRTLGPTSKSVRTVDNEH